MPQRARVSRGRISRRAQAPGAAGNAARRRVHTRSAARGSSAATKQSDAPARQCSALRSIPTPACSGPGCPPGSQHTRSRWARRSRKSQKLPPSQQAAQQRTARVASQRRGKPRARWTRGCHGLGAAGAGVSAGHASAERGRGRKGLASDAASQAALASRPAGTAQRTLARSTARYSPWASRCARAAAHPRCRPPQSSRVAASGERPFCAAAPRCAAIRLRFSRVPRRRTMLTVATPRPAVFVRSRTISRRLRRRRRRFLRACPTRTSCRCTACSSRPTWATTKPVRRPSARSREACAALTAVASRHAAVCLTRRSHASHAAPLAPQRARASWT